MKTEVPEYIQNPLLPITISVIGCGGSGSMFLQHLARVVHAYQTLHNRRVSVIVCDGSKVDTNNVGRQAFGTNEIGYYKSDITVSRINRFYGFEWIAVPENFVYVMKDNQIFLRYSSNFIVSAVDTVAARLKIEEFFLVGQEIKNTPEYLPHFWIDMGNSKSTGNVIVASHSMQWPNIFEHESSFTQYPDSEPNCSLAMSLNQQDMFINSQCALVAAKWLWECLSSKEITWRGAFINLDTFIIRKIKVNNHVTTQGNTNNQQKHVPGREPDKTKNSSAAARKRKGKNRIRKRK